MIWTPHGIGRTDRRRQIPSSGSLSKSEDILRKVIKDSGLTPGVYKNFEGLDYEALEFVHTRLCEVLEDEIAKFELVHVCNELYEVHEKFMAQNEILTGQNAIGIHSVRSLIELAVKCCNETGAPLDEEGRDYLLALALQAIGWDYIWDQFSLGFFRQEVVIGQTYEFRPQELSGKYHAAQREYEKDIAARKRMMEILHDGGIVLPNDGYFHRESLLLWVREAGFLGLDGCLNSGVGYSLIDYLLFRNAALDVAISKGFDIVGLERTQFVSYCIDLLGFEESAIDALIEDFALSKGLMCSVPSTQIFSTGRRNRDSRFIRRPIVRADINDDTALFFGRASLAEASDLFLRQVISGRIPVSRWQENAEVKREFGKIQASRGGPFNKAIAKECEKVADIDHVIPEKGHISGVKSDPDLGAIDIFLVDNARKRFVLVEVKNSGDRAGTPLIMSDEYRTFTEDFLPTLKAKTEWFRSHINALKKEFAIPDEKDYKVEGVIVVNQRRLWVMMHESRLPILDDDEFLERLGAGQDLLSNLNGIMV